MPEFGFITEHTVGHVTFERVLREAVAADPTIAAAWLPLAYPRLERAIPNWSLRASLRARVALERSRRWDALLFHTQTVSLLAVGVMRRVPTAISLDATPRNLDEVAAGYSHTVGPPAAERVKAELVGRALRAARALIAWSEWVRASLVEDYRVDERRVRVIPAGTRLPPAPGPRPADEMLRLLFVGGDFERKGGRTLLAALEEAEFLWALDIVTQSDVPARGRVRVHHGVQPGSPQLDALYAAADAFVLPTAADASPHVVLEAMAAGLPVVSTPTGAIPEMVGDGGVLVAPGDPAALRAALARLREPVARTRLGRCARERAEARYDAVRNARGVLDVLREISSS